MTVLKRDHDDRHASSAKRREDDRQRARKYSKRTAKARWLKQKNDPAYKAKKAAQARARYTKRKLLNA